MKELVDEVRRRGINLPLLDPLQRHPQEPHRRAQRSVPSRDDRVRLQGRLQGRLPDQGQPGPLRRREDHADRQAVPLRPRGRLEAGAARRHGDARGRRGAHHLQRLQGRGVRRDGAARVEARAAPSSSSSRRRPSCKLIADISKRMGVKPRIGMRAKLSTRGSGRWEASGGDRSKFGLTSREMIEAVDFLQAERPARTRSSCCTSTSARRSARSARSRTRCARPGASSSSCTRWARR